MERGQEKGGRASWDGGRGRVPLGRLWFQGVEDLRQGACSGGGDENEVGRGGPPQGHRADPRPSHTAVALLLGDGSRSRSLPGQHRDGQMVKPESQCPREGRPKGSPLCCLHTRPPAAAAARVASPGPHDHGSPPGDDLSPSPAQPSPHSQPHLPVPSLVPGLPPLPRNNYHQCPQLRVSMSNCAQGCPG